MDDMDERRIDVRTELAASPLARVEIGQDGVLHVLVGQVTLHLDRDACEELTTTLARAVIALVRQEKKQRKPALRLVDGPRSGSAGEQRRPRPFV